jgi:SAM-dependent methyltransferase
MISHFIEGVKYVFNIIVRLCGHMERFCKKILFRSEKLYRHSLVGKRSCIRGQLPTATWHNAVLKDKSEIEKALEKIRSLGLPPYPSTALSKNWDTLAMFDCILKNTDQTAQVLDAGGCIDSPILSWLFLYGYKNLIGINKVILKEVHRGPIVYAYGDITKTRYQDGMFDAVVCQSVIEHGVDIEEYFKEMNRILKPNGLLLTSTDYYEHHIDTGGQVMYGTPFKIFDRGDIEDLLAKASVYNFELTGPLDMSCNELPVCSLGVEYTFLLFTMRKRA